MADARAVVAAILSAVLCVTIFPARAGAWGPDGHQETCRIAEALMEPATLKAVRSLLPDYANGSLASLCVWADEIKKFPEFYWTIPLHHIDTPDFLCSYNFERDCHDEQGNNGQCASGAITNFTSQLTKYKPEAHISRPLLRQAHETEHNYTFALLLLSHIVGDIHQPMHIGFTSDDNANLILVNWYDLKGIKLHHIWDIEILVRDKDLYHNSSQTTMVNSIVHNINNNWIGQAKLWSECSNGELACPDVYASEGVVYACEYGYKDAPAGTTLKDEYFLSRYPIVERRIAQGGVRLAAILNRIFRGNSISQRPAFL